MSTSYEIGTEWKFFNYRLDLDFTYYRTNTKNQLLKMPSSAGALYKFYYVNAGNIQNEGVELTLAVNSGYEQRFPLEKHIQFLYQQKQNYITTQRAQIIRLWRRRNEYDVHDENCGRGFSRRYLRK